MSVADCTARISAIDALIQRFDPGWTSMLPSSSMSSVQALDPNSPFSDVLESVSTTSSTAGSTAGAGASVNVLPLDERTATPDTLLGPVWGNIHELTQESESDALARFDAVSGDIPYAAQIRQAAVDQGIDPLLLAGLVRWESNFHQYATSRCGAMGLTQLMPGTARGLGVTDPWDALQNLEGGAKYLATQLKRFGRVDMAVASYNAGPGAVAALGKVPDNKWHYVDGVLGTWESYEGKTR